MDTYKNIDIPISKIGDDSIEKLGSVKFRMHQIINHLKFQYIGIFMGLGLYPSLYLIGLDYIIAWTPVCCIIHYTSYLQQCKLLEYEVNKYLIENKIKKYKYASLKIFNEKSYLRSLFGNRVDIHLHEAKPKFNFNNVVIPINTTSELTLHELKPIKIKRRNIFNLINYPDTTISIIIPPVYLKSAYLEQVNELIKFRQVRFRTYLMWIVTLIGLLTYVNFTSFSVFQVVQACIMTWFITQPTTPKCTHYLEFMLEGKELEAICFIENVNGENISIKDYYWYVNMMNNLVITNSKWTARISGRYYGQI